MRKQLAQMVAHEEQSEPQVRTPELTRVSMTPQIPPASLPLFEAPGVRPETAPTTAPVWLGEQVSVAVNPPASTGHAQLLDEGAIPTAEPSPPHYV